MIDRAIASDYSYRVGLRLRFLFLGIVLLLALLARIGLVHLDGQSAYFLPVLVILAVVLVFSGLYNYRPKPTVEVTVAERKPKPWWWPF